MQRIRTPWHEIRDVDLGPKPANLFAPAGGYSAIVTLSSVSCGGSICAWTQPSARLACPCRRLFTSVPTSLSPHSSVSVTA